MDFLKIAVISATLCSACAAGVRSGKAEADWISASDAVEGGKPVQTAIRLKVDEGWHTYWENPGEAGMKISVVWDLPDGWKADEVQHPAPKRFMTGELAGFGYEGTVIFPVTFTPPAGFTGDAKLKGKVSWLTCNDESCIPGKAELELVLKAGLSTPTAQTKLIEEAMQKIPKANLELKLTVAESAKTLVLTLSGAKSFRPDDYEVFPATPQAVETSAQFQFTERDGVWVAEVPRSEYASEPIKELTLVLGKTNNHRCR